MRKQKAGRRTGLAQGEAVLGSAAEEGHAGMKLGRGALELGGVFLQCRARGILIQAGRNAAAGAGVHELFPCNAFALDA